MGGIRRLVSGEVAQSSTKGKGLVKAIARMNSNHCKSCGKSHKKGKHLK